MKTPNHGTLETGSENSKCTELCVLTDPEISDHSWISVDLDRARWKRSTNPGLSRVSHRGINAVIWVLLTTETPPPGDSHRIPMIGGRGLLVTKTYPAVSTCQAKISGSRHFVSNFVTSLRTVRRSR